MNDIAETTDDVGFAMIAVKPALKRRIDARQARIQNEQGGRKPSMNAILTDALNALEQLESSAAQL